MNMLDGVKKKLCLIVIFLTYFCVVEPKYSSMPTK